MIAALLSAAALTGADAPDRCFDWAVVGRVTRQTFLGVPRDPDGGLMVDGVYRWDVRVRAALMGEDAPRRVTVGVMAHTAWRSAATRRVVLFLRRDADGQMRLVGRNVLDRNAQRSEWAAKVAAMAAEARLVQCGDDGPPHPKIR